MQSLSESMRHRISPVLPWLIAIAAIFTAGLDVAHGQATPGPVTTEAFGSPSFLVAPAWQPVDFNFFSAGISSFDEFNANARAVFPPPNHLPDAAVGLRPGAAHAPPYDTEVSQGVAAAGFVKKNVFNVNEFTGGQGVYLLWNVVATAGAPVGSSPDFAQGRIIPNSLFPITFEGDTLRNGSLFDPNWFATAPKLSEYAPPIAGDGYSHYPIPTAEAFEFQDTNPDPNINPQPGTDPTGSYIHMFTLTDTQGNDWRINAPFAVVPEPAAIALVVPAAAGLMRRRRGR
jgi:hypothetical protein